MLILINISFVLGNELDAKDKHVLKEKKITDIMNVTAHIPFFYENNFNYYRIPANDSDKQNLSQYFDEAFRIIGIYVRPLYSISKHF